MIFKEGTVAMEDAANFLTKTVEDAIVVEIAMTAEKIATTAVGTIRAIEVMDDAIVIEENYSLISL